MAASETNRPRRSRRVSIQQANENENENQNQARAKWTIYLTKTLADLMVEQVYRGKRQKSWFEKKAWEYMCNEFQKKTGLEWDKEQLKNRHGVMRKQHATVKSLLDLNEFSWDESLSMVNAKDHVWDEYIKAHPDAEVIRSNGCPYYKQLCIIFGEMRYDDDDDDDELKIKEGGLFHKESSSTEDDEEYKKGTRKRNHTGAQDIMARAILEIAAASKLRTGARGRERFCITNCVKALDEMQGVDDGIYYAALDLFDQPNLRETFMSLKVNKRLGWFKAKCNAPLSSII